MNLIHNIIHCNQNSYLKIEINLFNNTTIISKKKAIIISFQILLILINNINKNKLTKRRRRKKTNLIRTPYGHYFIPKIREEFTEEEGPQREGGGGPHTVKQTRKQGSVM